MTLFVKRDNYLIRNAVKGDVDEINNLVQRAFFSYGNKGSNPASYETIENIEYDLDNNIVLVIEYLGMIVGSLRLIELNNKVFYLKRFSIHPDYQNLGMGTILYYNAEKKLKEKIASCITLHSSTEDRRLISFYKKLGFKCIKKDWEKGYERGFWVKNIWS